MSNLPLIGITVHTSDANPRFYESASDYALSVERAGGLPVMLPYRNSLSLISHYVDLLDGIVFSGGDDLDPAAYGESYHPKAEPVDPERQKFEMALLAEVERRQKPVLGICLGSQMMNVYRGGSLYQFLPELERENPLEHRRLDNPKRRHMVNIEPETVLAGAIGKPEVEVNTRHKQAVRRVGRGLRVNARATDGTIEGIEDPTLPLFLAVQWHPENLTASPDHLALFKLLIEKSRR